MTPRTLERKKERKKKCYDEEDDIGRKKKEGRDKVSVSVRVGSVCVR